MGWFKKSRLQQEHDDIKADAKVEIIAHQKATAEQLAEVQKANEVLNKIFERNHFTLTIYVAAGGKSEELTTQVPGETPKEWERKK